MSPEAFIEDADFLARNGETLSRAAQRMGYTKKSMVTKLQKLGQGDLLNRLRLNDPDYEDQSFFGVARGKGYYAKYGAERRARIKAEKGSAA